MRKYPSLKLFMFLNGYKDKKKSRVLLSNIKKAFKNGQSVSLNELIFSIKWKG